LPQFDKYPEASKEVQGLIDAYSALPKNDGPKGGNKSRSMWIQSHPNEWAAMTDQFNKQSQYNLENDAARAIYENEDFSDKGNKAIASLAKSGGSGSSSSSGSYSSSSSSRGVASSRSSGSSGKTKNINVSQYLSRIAVKSAPSLKKGPTAKKVAIRPAKSAKAKMTVKKAAV
jgi:hypothetical protein